MLSDIGFHPQGNSHSYNGITNWMSVNAALDETQIQRIESCLRAWRRPGRLRWLRHRFGQPSIIGISVDRHSKLKLIFRDEHNRLAVARSCRAQVELAEIIADTLGWNRFKFRHRTTEDLQDVHVERDDMGAPWHHTNVTPPQPPRLVRSTPLHYRHT